VSNRSQARPTARAVLVRPTGTGTGQHGQRMTNQPPAPVGGLSSVNGQPKTGTGQHPPTLARMTAPTDDGQRMTQPNPLTDDQTGQPKPTTNG